MARGNEQAQTRASVDVVSNGDAVLVRITGLVNEHFSGFGDLANAKAVVIDVSGMTRLTSFGVRRWLDAMDQLPKPPPDVYLLGCPTFFVDQLNMVLNFGGPGKVLSVVAPYACSGCAHVAHETIDVLAARADIAKDVVPDKACPRCGGTLVFDETPESYFSFLARYTPAHVHVAATQLLAANNLYTNPDLVTEKPPRVIKLVHGAVTYFRIIGSINSLFRSRPFVSGVEGEVVLDLAELEHFERVGLREWRRMIESLSAQVPAITLVDVNESFLAVAADTLTLSKNLATTSVLVPYRCNECRRVSRESVRLDGARWPLRLRAHVCPSCGSTMNAEITSDALSPLKACSATAPPASAKVIAQRDELLSRALTDAKVAQAGERATTDLGADDILNRYKIIRPLSAGGMAEVFLATQVGIGGFEKTVALKRIQRKLLETRNQAIELFLNEAKIAGRLMHPNIVQVLDVGEVGGALYLAMEYVHGKDLRTVLRRLQRERTTIPLASACFIIHEIAQALHHAYWSKGMDGERLSVVHCDVSPHNVILSFGGNVKLLDFGVAMSAVTEHNDALIVGKWMYMAPEAVTQKQVDHRSDLFSLGVILYLMCAGTPPFTAREPKQIVKQIRAGEYKPLHEYANIPPRLAKLAARLLSPNPADRPQTGNEVATEVAEIARAHDLPLSGLGIAELLAQLYSDDVRNEGQTIEIACTTSGVSDRVTGESPATPPPGHIDISKTFRRSSVVERGIDTIVEPHPEPTVTRPTMQTSETPPLAPAKHPIAPASRSALPFLVVLLVLAAAGAAVYYALLR